MAKLFIKNNFYLSFWRFRETLLLIRQLICHSGFIVSVIYMQVTENIIFIRKNHNRKTSHVLNVKVELKTLIIWPKRLSIILSYHWYNVSMLRSVTVCSLIQLPKSVVFTIINFRQLLKHMESLD